MASPAVRAGACALRPRPKKRRSKKKIAVRLAGSNGWRSTWVRGPFLSCTHLQQFDHAAVRCCRVTIDRDESVTLFYPGRFERRPNCDLPDLGSLASRLRRRDLDPVPLAPAAVDPERVCDLQRQRRDTGGLWTGIGFGICAIQTRRVFAPRIGFGICAM